MAVKGPKGPSASPPALSSPPEAPLQKEAAPSPSFGRSMPEVGDQPGQREQRDRAAAELTGEGRIGDLGVTPEEFAAMGTLIAARHLMTLLAKKRAAVERPALLEEAGELVLSLSNPTAIRRILLSMGEVGRIVDIYPLEVLDYVLSRDASLLPGFEYGPVILNKEELEARPFAVEELIRIKVPLSLKMRAFALEGGGTPGYCFAPGPPAEYHLEVADAGRFPLLVRGEVRKKSILDRAILTITEAPE